MKRIVYRPLAIITIATMLFACGEQQSSEPNGQGGEVSAGDAVAQYERAGEGGDDALLEGTLRHVNGCLIVESDGGRIVIPAFPYNEVTWNGVTFSWEDASFEVGEHVRFAGGYTSSAPSFVTIPHSCDASGDYFIAHSLA